MIKITGYYINSKEKHEESPQLLHPYGALRRLAVYELGYGGRVTSVRITGDQTIITISTNFLNCVETNIFSGSQHEMSILMGFLGCYIAVAKDRKIDVMSQFVLNAIGGSNVLITANLSSILIGQSEVFSALVLWAGLETEEQVSLARDLVSHNTRSEHSGLNEFIEAIEFINELGISFEEYCQQVGRVVYKSFEIV